jgi:predicted transcriptional regulator
MSNAFVPYNGTAGWSGTETSQQRALYNLRTGKEYNNQQKALALLKEARANGLTWKELSEHTGMHHGTASGVLSVLHKEGEIARLYRTRGRCKIYINTFTAQMNPDMLTESYKKKSKPCPHCGDNIYGTPV